MFSRSKSNKSRGKFSYRLGIFLSCVGVFLGHVPGFAAAKDDAPRPTGVQIVTDQTAFDLQKCLASHFTARGIATPQPVADGVELAITFNGGLVPDKPRFFIRIHDRGADRMVESFYRRPLSAKLTAKQLRDAMEICTPTRAG